MIIPSEPLLMKQSWSLLVFLLLCHSSNFKLIYIKFKTSTIFQFCTFFKARAYVGAGIGFKT